MKIKIAMTDTHTCNLAEDELPLDTVSHTSGPEFPLDAAEGDLHEKLTITQGGLMYQEVFVRKGNTWYCALPGGDSSVSTRIRNRIQRAGASFVANDNISDYIAADELVQLQAEVATKMQSVLETLVIDTANDHNTQATAERVAKMFVRELYKGRYEPMPSVTVFPNSKKLDELYIVGPVTVRSTCSHHLVPIIGKAWVGVLPSDSLNGLSKFSRLVDWVFGRPQIQEEATVQVADLLETLLKPRALGVIVKANHMCMALRGVKEPCSAHITSVMRGALRTDAALKQEFLRLIED